MWSIGHGMLSAGSPAEGSPLQEETFAGSERGLARGSEEPEGESARATSHGATQASTDDAHRMEIFGLGSALDHAPCSRRWAETAIWRPVGEHRNLRAAEEAPTTNNIAHVRQEMLQEWHWASLRELPTDPACGGSATVGSASTSLPADAIVAEAIPPTPSEILAASSIRMTLSMATAFRMTNPAVLQAMCGTLLDLLLEIPQLSLVPLDKAPTSIEAITFRKVGEFCSELMASSDPLVNKSTLGLYLALAISRGTVSGLLEVVRCLLEHHPFPEAQKGVDASTPSASPSTAEGDCNAAATPPIGQFERGANDDDEQGDKISAVLDRLANHRVHLRLSFPDEHDGTSFTINVPERMTRTCSNDVAASCFEPGASKDAEMAWECPASAATDGAYVYAWHPDIGLLKAGTGLRGTTKGTLYAVNAGAGRSGDVNRNGTGRREGFVGVMGGIVYVRGGCMSPHEFLVVRTSDLVVERTIHVAGLDSSFRLPSSTADWRHPRRGPHVTAAPAPRKENATKPRDHVASTIEGGQTGGNAVGPYVPLCCDGELIYALVPSQRTGRPSLISVDVANAGRTETLVVELQSPQPSHRNTWAAASTAHPAADEASLRVNIDGDIIRPNTGNSGEEWPWWQRVRGAITGVRIYCNRDWLNVCWFDGLGTAAAASEEASPVWRDRVARAEARLGIIPGEQESVVSGGDSHFKRITYMAKFRLLTGACEGLEKATFNADSWLQSPPWLSYDSGSNLIMRCSLRRPLPLPSSIGNDGGGDALKAVLRMSIWQNGGLAPGLLADGPFSWAGILCMSRDGNPIQVAEHATRDRREGSLPDVPAQHRGPRLSSRSNLPEIAVFVLAHLDRLATHYLGGEDNSVCRKKEKSYGQAMEDRSSVPLCYDVTPATFGCLIELVQRCTRTLGTALRSEGGQKATPVEEQERLELYVLCASIRLLNVNIGMLLSRGFGLVEFGGEERRHSLLHCLIRLIEGCEDDWAAQKDALSSGGDGGEARGSIPLITSDVGRAAVATEALRLLVDGLDLFYITQRHQAALLLGYLGVFEEHGRSRNWAAAPTIMLELLSRAASLRFLRGLQSDVVAVPAGFQAEAECVGPGLIGSNCLSLLSDDMVDSLAKALVKWSKIQSVREVQVAADRDTMTAAPPTEKASMLGVTDARSNAEPAGTAGPISAAVQEAFASVLKLCFIDALREVESDPRGHRDRIESGETNLRPLLRLFVMVFRAADVVLTAAVATQSPKEAAGALKVNISPGVVDALLPGLVGVLLPSCLASALALIERSGKWASTSVCRPLLTHLQEPLVQITCKLGRLAAPGWSRAIDKEGYRDKAGTSAGDIADICGVAMGGRDCHADNPDSNENMHISTKDHSEVNCSTTIEAGAALSRERESAHHGAGQLFSRISSGEEEILAMMARTEGTTPSLGHTGSAHTESILKRSPFVGGASLARVEGSCAALGASMVRGLLAGMPLNLEEQTSARWLRHPLFLHATMKREVINSDIGGPAETMEQKAKGGEAIERTALNGPWLEGKEGKETEINAAARVRPLFLLAQLCHRPADLGPRALSMSMKHAVLEDQGRDKDANEVVWATAAAVLHHAGLANEAYQVARKRLESGVFGGAAGMATGATGDNITLHEIPPALTRAWRLAQRARSWWNGIPVLGRDKSRLIARASFLLRFTPWISRDRVKSSRVEESPDTGVTRILAAGELVLQYLLRSMRDGIVYSGSARAPVDDEDAFTDAEDLGAGDPEPLMRVITSRSSRAAARANGFSLAQRLLDGMCSNPSAAEILQAVADGLTTACAFADEAEKKSERSRKYGDVARGTSKKGHGSKRASLNIGQHDERECTNELSHVCGRLHFLRGVECNDAYMEGAVVGSVAIFLRQCSVVLERTSGLTRASGGAKPRTQIEALLVRALRAVCMDYDRRDHTILHESRLLPLVFELVDDPCHAVAAEASQTLQALYRCVISSSVNDLASANWTARNGADSALSIAELRETASGRGSSSSFQAAFFRGVQHKVQAIANDSGWERRTTNVLDDKVRSSSPGAPALPTGSRTLLEGAIALTCDRAGMVAPHFARGTRHSLSAWVYIPPIALDHATASDSIAPAGSDDENTVAASHVLVTGARCAVRRTPDMSSEEVAVLRAEEVVKVRSPERQWARHPLVLGGRCVRLFWPVEGYASLRSSDGSVVLQAVPVSAASSRRSLSLSDLRQAVDTAGIVNISRESCENRTVVDDEVKLYQRGCDDGPMSGRIGPGESADREEARSRPAHSQPRRSRSGPLDDSESHMNGEWKQCNGGADATGSLTFSKDAEHGEVTHFLRPSASAATGDIGGGILLFRGNEILLGEEEEPCSWNRAGIEVTSGGALRFFVGEGDRSEAVVTTPDGALFGANGEMGRTINGGSMAAGQPAVAIGWRHVAVVQDQSDVSLYVGGRRCGKGSMPRHLSRPSCPRLETTVREVQSAHPYPNSVDRYWRVHVAGAKSLTVRFDPKSRTEAEYDFVRFYKDRTRMQIWGLDKYHGGRCGSPSNWPGVDSPPLVIPAESFVVYFHTDGSNNDYGFRLTAEGAYAVFAEPSPLQAPRVIGDVSPWPTYLGQPPPHASLRHTVVGGKLAEVRVWDRPLLDEDVQKLASDPPPAAVSSVITGAEAGSEGKGQGKERQADGEDVAATAQALALAHACSRTKFGREKFTGTKTVHALLTLVLVGNSETRRWALRVCRRTLPWVTPSLVDEEFRSIVRRRQPGFEGSFVEACLLVVGGIANVWGCGRDIPLEGDDADSGSVDCRASLLSKTATKYGPTAAKSMLDMLLRPPSRYTTGAQVSAREAFSLSAELVSMLHVLAVQRINENTNAGEVKESPSDGLSTWGKEITGVLRAWLPDGRRLVEVLQQRKGFQELRRRKDATLIRLPAEGNHRSPAPVVLQPKGQGALTEIPGLKADVHSDYGGGRTRLDHEDCSSKEPVDGKDDFHQPGVARFSDATVGILSVVDLDRIVAVLCLIGGQFSSLHPGGNVLCHMPSEENEPVFVRGQSGSQERGRRWEKDFAEEVTVLRLGLSRGWRRRVLPCSIEGDRSTDSSVYLQSSSAGLTDGNRRGRGDANERDMREATVVQGERPVLATRLVPSPPGCVRPLDVYDGLANDGQPIDAREPLAVAMTRADVRDRSDQRQRGCQRRPEHEHQEQFQEQEQQIQDIQQEDISARMLTARLGSVLPRQGRGWVHMQRELPSSLPPPLPPPAAAAITAAEREGAIVPPTGGRITVPTDLAPSTSDERQPSAEEDRQLASTAEGWVTVASEGREGTGDGLRVATVPVHAVVPLCAPVPPAFTRILLSNVKELVPTLKAILEVDTAFRGPVYAPLRKLSDFRHVIESAHPYEHGQDRLWPLIMTDAETFEVSFDPMSRFVNPGDHLLLSWRTPSGGDDHRRILPSPPSDWGGSVSGIRTDQVWPGVGDERPMVVVGHSLQVRFVSGEAIRAAQDETDKGENEAKGNDKGDAQLAEAWGFRLVAKSKQTQQISPPAQPPSQTRAILCDLQARAAKSVTALLEDSRASARLVPLMPALARVALQAAPPIPAESSTAMVPAPDEAGTLPPPTFAAVTVPAERLEPCLSRAYDLLYERPKAPDQLPEAAFASFPLVAFPTSESTSSEDISSADFPTNCVNSKSPIIRNPESSFLGKSEDAGRVLERAKEVSEGQEEKACPRRYVVCVGGVEGFDAPMMHEQSGTRMAQLRHGAMVTVMEQRRDWLKLIFDASIIFTHGVAAAAADGGIPSGTNDQNPISGTPAYIWVRQRQDDTIFLLPEALADDERRGGEDPGAGMENKAVFELMPAGEADDEGEEEELLREGGVDGASVRKEGGLPDEGYDWAESMSPFVPGISGFEENAHDVKRGLRGCAGHALTRFTADTLRTAAARFGVSALLAAAARFGGGIHERFCSDLFGSVENLWEFLRLTAVSEKGNLKSPAFTMLRRRVIEFVTGDGAGPLGRALVTHALNTLQRVAAEPGRRAMVKFFETPHPYQNNMDINWNVDMPGARRMKVVFDPRSRTETNCDWVCILQQQRDGMTGTDSSDSASEQMGYARSYHGRGGSENFPGFGGRPSLWLEGDRFSASFHSDSTTTDWGVRFKVYGILGDDFDGESDSDNSAKRSTWIFPAGTERTAESVAAFGPASVERHDEDDPSKYADTGGGGSAATTSAARRKTTHDVNLSCWLLELMSHAGRKIPEVAARLCDKDALRAYHDCLTAFSQRRRLRVLRLVSCVFAEAEKNATASGFRSPFVARTTGALFIPRIQEFHALLHVVVGMTDTQRAIEGDTGASSFLQALIQCAALLQSFLVTVRDRGSNCEPEVSGLQIETGNTRPAVCQPLPATNIAFSGESGDRITCKARTTSSSIPQPAQKNLAPKWPDVSCGAGAVKDVMAIRTMLAAFSQGNAPVRLLLDVFLPMLTEAFSVTVQSSHPFVRLAHVKRVIVIPGAEQLLARFDHRTEMGSDDVIIVRNPVRRHSLPPDVALSSGETGGNCDARSGLLLDGDECSLRGLAGGTDDKTLAHVSVGDWVTRGPDWSFGDEDARHDVDRYPTARSSSDEGPTLGLVVALDKWDGREGVRVRWTGATTIGDDGRMAVEPGGGFEALYSVRDPAHVRVVRRSGVDPTRGPVAVAGNALEVECMSTGEGDDASGESAAVSSNDDRQSGARCYHFDGESTHIDLPSYSGMRLEGDFTLELWAWLEPGSAEDGKPKCLISRALDQPLPQSRRLAVAGREKIHAPATPAPSESTSSANASILPFEPGVEQNNPGLSATGDAEATMTSDLNAKNTAIACSELPCLSSPKDAAHAAEHPSQVQEALGMAATSRTAQSAAGENPPRPGVNDDIPPRQVESGDCSSFSTPELVQAKTLTAVVTDANAVAGSNVNIASPLTTNERQHQGLRAPGWEWVGLRRRAFGTDSGVSDADEAVRKAGCESSNDSRGDTGEAVSVIADHDGETGRQKRVHEEKILDRGPTDVRQDSVVLDAVAAVSASSAPSGGSRGDGILLEGGIAPERSASSEDASKSSQRLFKSPPPGAVTSDNVYVGLRVKRGPHWTYRRQDGGGSKVGTVVGTRGLNGCCPPDGDNPIHEGWTKVRWDDGRANSYETGRNGKYAISFEDAVPGAPRDLAVSGVTDNSISITWSPPARRGRPPLQSYIIYRDDTEIATVGADVLSFTNTNRMRGWPYSYSIAAQGLSGTSPRCAPVPAATATENDRRTQLALWVGGRGEIQFAMGNESGKGVILRAGRFQEETWTHLAVSVEGRKVSVIVDGERRASGTFAGRRLCSRHPSSLLHNLLSDGETERSRSSNAEPLRLGSRGAQDYWRGRLRRIRVWGVASSVSDVHRRMRSGLPAALFARAAPPPTYAVAVRGNHEVFWRLRVHAPLPDTWERVTDVPASVGRLGGNKAFYEVFLRSGGCMQIGWALPSSCPSSPNVGVGDDDHSWAVDGLRGMKWHGSTSPVSSPYAHGVPYGKGWKWEAGDVIGCAVDLDAGVMSFSHNGCNLGKAFVRARGRGTGRYRVVAPNGVECRVGIDAESPVVEIFSPGTVLQVSQVENISQTGTWRLRTAEGWVAERAVDDPDAFFLERLEQDACEFSGTGVGPERCVFADSLRLREATVVEGETDRGGGYDRSSRVQVHALCRDVLIREDFGEVSGAPKVTSSDNHVAAPLKGLYTLSRPQHSLTILEEELFRCKSGDGGGLATAGSNVTTSAPVRSLLARSIDVGDANAVTFLAELFVPDECVANSGSTTGTVAPEEGSWRWGVVVGDFDIYLSMQPGSVRKEKDNGGYNATGEEAALLDQCGGRVGSDSESGGDGCNGGDLEEAGWAMDLVINGPGGFLHALPLCVAFRGRWILLRIIAHRSGESLLVCTPSIGGVDTTSCSRFRGDVNSARSTHAEGQAVGSPGESERADQQQQLRCTFSNPRFFRGDRVGCVGLYSQRSPPRRRSGGDSDDVSNDDDNIRPFRARHVVMLLRSVEDLPLPTLPRLRQLESLVAAEHQKRLAEQPARPLLVYARRLRRLWAGDILSSLAMPLAGGPLVVPTPPQPSTAAVEENTGVYASQEAKRPTNLHCSTLSMWQAVLSPGRVAFGTAVYLSAGNYTSTGGDRNVDGGSDRGSGELFVQSTLRPCLTAWEHPALQTPASFTAVPLPSTMSSGTSEREGIWAWAPVPRSDSFLAVGLVFTAGPEPPRLTDARCVLRKLVQDADPSKCKVVRLPCGPEERGRSGVDTTSFCSDTCPSPPCCTELVIVKEMGVCVPLSGSIWGLSPRMVIGDAGTSPGLRKLRWDGLMPTLSGTAGESMVINLGHAPFRHPVEGYRPVCDMVQADARFVLQVYKHADRMWQDVQRSHGILDAKVPPQAPDLIGSWLLRPGGAANHSNAIRETENEVFATIATSTRSTDGDDARGTLVRLPSAYVGGALEAAVGGPPAPPLNGQHQVWGFSLRVSPVFPSRMHGAATWVRAQFDAFTARVWGEQGEAHAFNNQLISYINTVALRRGLSKDILLSCDWNAVRSAYADLADWPLLQSAAGATSGSYHAEHVPTGAITSMARNGAKESPTGAGVEEKKESPSPGVMINTRLEEPTSCVGKTLERRDEWVVATADTPVQHIEVLESAVSTAKVAWRLACGQIARLLPLPPVTASTARVDGRSEATSEGRRWRQARGAGGEAGWLSLPAPGTSEDRWLKLGLKRFWTDRHVLSAFSREAQSRLADHDSGRACEASAGSRRAVESPVNSLWVPLKLPGSAAVLRNYSITEALSPAPLEGKSDALLMSALDVGAPALRGSSNSSGGDNTSPGSNAGSLLVAGRWKVGLITDTLTVTTRTSGYTKSFASCPADATTSAALAALDGGAGEVGDDPLLDPLPVLVDGLVFGFRAADGLLTITRALSNGIEESQMKGIDASTYVDPDERQATACLGRVNEGAEVTFMIIDGGDDVTFSCKEVGSRQRSATTRVKDACTWGRTRVALGARAARHDSTRGWVRIVSQDHGATVRSGMSIDSDRIVGKIPCGSVVPYNNAIIYHSPGSTDDGIIDPVVRYHCTATPTTPAGWISERGRYAHHPYRICEQVRAQPHQPAHLISHVTVGRIVQSAADDGNVARTGMSGGDFLFPLPQHLTGKTHFADVEGAESRGGVKTMDGEEEWQRRLKTFAVLPVRFHLLQQLNRGVANVLRNVNILQGDLPWSTAAMLSRSRHLLFSSLKQEVWQTELERTARPVSSHDAPHGVQTSLELRLSRGRAKQHASSTARRRENEERHTLFGQALVALRDAPLEAFRLRAGEALYSTIFLGEHAHDVGGPYRESFAEYCAELQSDALPVLIPCPNAVNDVGINREKWVPNPAIEGLRRGSSVHCEMLGLLGRLMGVSIRSHQPLDLDLPSIVWKQLVRTPINMHDVEAIDYSLAQSLSAIRAIHVGGVTTEEAFRDLGLGGFEVATANGGKAELPISGGASREITLGNRLVFVDMVEAYKIREFWAPVEVIRRGLASVIPIQLLRLLAWDELEALVCGRKDVDVDLLENCTEYSLCDREDKHVSAFWDVLRSFSAKEKSLFLRFAWGRSRLPMSAEHFHQPFKIQAFTRTPADAYLPVAHTCFFSLELPRYSTREVLESKLRYAIHNCLAIDADDTSVGRNAAGLGWGEEP